MKRTCLLFSLVIAVKLSSGQTFTNLQLLTGSAASGEVLNLVPTQVMSGGTPFLYNTIHDLTAAKLGTDNGDIKDFTFSGTSFTGALGSATVTLNPAGAIARVREDHGYTGAPPVNNPGTISGNTFTLRFNSNVTVTNASFNFSSLNTGGIAWEYSVIQLLDVNGNPFNPITSPGWTLGAASQYGIGPSAGFFRTGRNWKLYCCFKGYGFECRYCCYNKRYVGS